jgi:RNA polymerase sigma factor (sigma-70 family)
VEDREFNERLAAGDREAFRLLVDRYQAKVINTCYGFLGRKEDAEDTAQEVFVEIYRSIQGFRGDSLLSTWIYRIAVTRSLDAVRARNRAKRLGQVKRLLGLDEIMNEMKAAEDMAPDLQLEEKERREILLRAIEALPENQRVAITLAKLEGFSYAEVADIMQTSISSIESLLFRARKSLEKKLTRYFSRRLSAHTRSQLPRKERKEDTP